MELAVYSQEALASALSNDFTGSDVIKNKNHFIYLSEYLGDSGVKAATILIENDYVSKDYLIDYISYYSLCFSDYHKRCKRIHFFDRNITDEDLRNFILSDGNKHNFSESYLGFIVVKPIPSRVIGFTILKTYSNENGATSRNYWGVRKYKVHLYGKELEIESLAFQEQDSVTAACATTAIWSMLNKASANFYTTLKSPSEITKDADNVSPNGSRLFPNKGLSLGQICQAIQNSGLVSEIINPDANIKVNGVDLSCISISRLKRIVNAYSSIGVPLILVIQVPSGGQHGLHAITVVGHTCVEPQPIEPTEAISWMSESINKLYAHDDQWGPFARIELENEAELHSPWTHFDGLNVPTYLKNIVVPVYPKIRISYQDIEAMVLGIDAIFTLLFGNNSVKDLVWDIKLVHSEDYKVQVNGYSISEESKLKVLTGSLPRYLWLATCTIGVNKVFDFTFDATDVSNGMYAKHFLSFIEAPFDNDLKNFLILNRSGLQQLFRHSQASAYYDFILNSIVIPE